MAEDVRRFEPAAVMAGLMLSVPTVALFIVGGSGATTALSFLVIVGAWTVLLARVVLRAARSAQVIAPVTLSVIVTAIMLMLLELILRFGVSTKATYAESNGGPYRSIYAYDNPTWYHLYQPNTTFTQAKTEFVHTRTINSLGLAEHEIDIAKPADEYRILALGDSYTEGVGASYDESWVKVLERKLPPLSDGRQVRTINAGISGSDLLFEYVLLRDRVAAYQPDLVILGLNNSDVIDLVTRGGMERFLPSGRTQGGRAPRWDWFYGVSYITRHVVHDVLGYTWLLKRPDSLAVAQHVAGNQMLEATISMAKLAHEVGARFVVVFNPHEYEVQAGAYLPEFKTVVDQVTAGHQFEAVDLLDIYMRTGTLAPVNSHDFYWKLDYHHNAHGYALMGETIAAEVGRRHLVPGLSQGAIAPIALNSAGPF